MPSIVPGFEYDIFISYRQKDNKGERWVTEFVYALKIELESTFKEDISIYFDENLHDGLLETHDVDESLKDKLKCLIFIPIVSQTYCDPKSFAWNHEFLAFKKLAAEDRFGLKVKLANGNVASRILPIKIHNLDPDDKAVIENEIGGVLRAIEFIYKEPGVNRPLKPTDHKSDNQNKTDYNNQVNKIANAIKEIIAAIKNPGTAASQTTTQSIPAKRSKKTLVAVILLLLLLIVSVAGYWGYSKLFFPNKAEAVHDRSIAVLPFVNLSDDPDQEYFSDGITEDVRNLLAKVPELKVIGRASAFYFKGKNEDLRVIGEKLGVEHLLEGSVRKDGNKLRVIVQLSRATDGALLWSETYNRTAEGIFELQDDISKSVADAMKLTLLGNDNSLSENVNPEAYSVYLQGRFYYENYPNDSEENNKAIAYFKKSITLDSTFALPYTYLTGCYLKRTETNRTEDFISAKRMSELAMQLDPYSVRSLISVADIAIGEYNLARAKQYIDKAIEIDPDDPYILRNATNVYKRIGLKDEAIEFGKKSLMLDPFNYVAQSNLFDSYRAAGRTDESIDAIKKFQKLGNPAFGKKASHYFNGIKLIDSGRANEIIQQQDSFDVELRAMAYLQLGKDREAEELIKNFPWKDGQVSGYQMARFYAFGNHPKEVKNWLEYCYNTGDLGFSLIISNPRLYRYKNESWFQDLLKKLQLPQ